MGGGGDTKCDLKLYFFNIFGRLKDYCVGCVAKRGEAVWAKKSVGGFSNPAGSRESIEMSIWEDLTFTLQYNTLHYTSLQFQKSICLER